MQTTQNKTETTQIIRVNNIDVNIIKKNIKHINLSVLPPHGIVNVSAPLHTSNNAIEMLIIDKLPWLKRQISEFKSQRRETPREYINGESHYFLGRRYILRIIKAKKGNIEIKNKKYMYLYVTNIDSLVHKKNVMNKWYKKELLEIIEPMINKWTKLLDIELYETRIKKMKTKWATSNNKDKRLWINHDLIKLDKREIEYVIVQQLTYLKSGNRKKSIALMDFYLPNWCNIKSGLEDRLLSISKI